MTPRLDPQGRRARILRATRDGATLSEVCRRVKPVRIASRHDASLQRLKNHAAIRKLKADGLLARTPRGWMPTADGLAVIDQMDVR